MTEYYKTADLPKHEPTEDEKRQIKEYMDNVQEEQRRTQDCVKDNEPLYILAKRFPPEGKARENNMVRVKTTDTETVLWVSKDEVIKRDTERHEEDAEKD